MPEDRDCISCGEKDPPGECPQSKVPCGHHCNHSWTHDTCDWCGREWGEFECTHDSTRIDGTLDAHCLKCGADGYWHYGHRHTEIHPSGKLLIRLDCPESKTFIATTGQAIKGVVV